MQTVRPQRMFCAGEPIRSKVLQTAHRSKYSAQRTVRFQVFFSVVVYILYILSSLDFINWMKYHRKASNLISKFRLLKIMLQHSKDLSTSPDNTFSHANASRKESMSTMLLECSSFSKSSKSQSNASTIERYKSLDCSDTIAHVNANGHDDNVSELAPCSESIHESSKTSETSNSETICDNIDKNKQFVDDDAETKECDLSDRRAGGYLIAVHRKLTRQDTYFLSYHKSRPSLFGVPLLIPCYEDGTNKDLYCAVWIQVARLLSPLPSTPPDQSNHATDW